jgi:DNA-binding CsgD family transcriptional regulator
MATWPGMMRLLMSMQGAMSAAGAGRRTVKPRGARFVIPTLTGREAEIEEMIRQKKTRTSIAETLGVSRQTLRDHIERMNAAKHEEGGKLWDK